MHGHLPFLICYIFLDCLKCENITIQIYLQINCIMYSSLPICYIFLIIKISVDYASNALHFLSLLTGVRLGFSCSTCGKQFSSAASLTQHKFVHSEQRYSCELCGKRFRFSGNKDKHMTLHSDNRPFACHSCGKSFKLKQYLKSHLKTCFLRNGPKGLARPGFE